jgi:predicted AlkP superfamily pyrophosphatase or phosphodiesterase
MPKSTIALCLLLAASSLLAQARQPVLLISVDGLRPDYVTKADENHLRIPNLRRMMAGGTYADGVTGVFPTVTYPSHTTLVTGVWPAEHGILNNTRFDPERNLFNAWYWYADQIKTSTLWSAAHAAGLHTASVSWPVTVDATSIDTLIPEYWRTPSPGDAFNPDDRFLMNAISRPDGELTRIAQRTATPYMMGNDTTLAGDEVRTRYSLDILQQHRPEFMTIHLSSLDEEEHLHGPFSPEANADLEGIDGMLARLAEQELRNYPNAVVVIVSDHGFAKVDHATNLYIPFIQVGLIQIDKSPSGAPVVKLWKAQPWIAGCMAPIVLHDPADSATRDAARSLLDILAADPANGIEAILDHNAVTALGGFPDAPFVVTFRPGYCNGGAISGPLVTDSTQKGTHGYNPATTPEMRASFFVTGQGIALGRDLGVVDMRQIAPALAQLLGVSLPSAKQPALSLH